jgi:hypothetical protein
MESGRRASFRNGEFARLHRSLLRNHQRRDGLGALAGSDGPGEGKQIPPMAIVREKCGDRRPVTALQSSIEHVEPLLDPCCIGLNGNRLPRVRFDTHFPSARIRKLHRCLSSVE